MTKNILLLAAVLGFIAQSSVFAADPTPSPSPSPRTEADHHHKHHKKSAAPDTFAFSDSQGLLRRYALGSGHRTNGPVTAQLQVI